MSSALSSSPSLIYRDPRLVRLRQSPFCVERFSEALFMLHDQSGDQQKIGEALCVFASMKIPGKLVIKFGLIMKTFPFVSCPTNGELARVARDRLIQRRTRFYASGERTPLGDLPLKTARGNQRNIQLGRSRIRNQNL